MNKLLIKSRFGYFLFEFSERKVINIRFPGDFPVFKLKYLKDDKNVVFIEKQLDDYLSGRSKNFSVPYILNLNPTYRNILNTLKDKVHYAEVVSYKELSKICNIKNGQRVVALAMKNNPLPIIFPCHRVIMTDKSMGGYGPGIFYKKMLLDMESTSISEIENS